MQGLLIGACIQLIWVVPSVALVLPSSANLNRTVCKAGEEQLQHKVFVHSLPKSATSSAGRALHLLGYRDCPYSPDQYFNHWEAVKAATKMVYGMDPTQVPLDVQENVRSLLVDFKAEADRCQSYSDWPIGHASTSVPLALKNILWPDGLYIWINRPFESWYDSFVRHEEGSEIFKEKMIPKEQLHSEYKALKDEAINFARARPGKLLYLEIEDVGWSPFVKFLFGDYCSAPDEEFPTRNTRTTEYVIPNGALEVEDDPSGQIVEESGGMDHLTKFEWNRSGRPQQ